MTTGTAIFVVAMVYFIIVSPGFRKFAVFVAAVGAIGLAYTITQTTIKAHEERVAYAAQQQEEAQASRRGIEAVLLPDVPGISADVPGISPSTAIAVVGVPVFGGASLFMAALGLQKRRVRRAEEKAMKRERQERQREERLGREQELWQREQQRRQQAEALKQQRQQEARREQRSREEGPWASAHAHRRQQWRNDEERRERQRANETSPSKSNVAWWDVLGVDPLASLEEVKASYRTRIKKYHPDRVEGLGEEFIALAREKTRRLNQAYEEAKARAGTSLAGL
jgi:hypothetical protein